MLGSMLYDYLEHRDIQVYGTQREDANLPFYLNLQEQYLNVSFLRNISPPVNYAVNCIGVTRFDRSSVKLFRLGFFVNAIFPAYLQEFCALHSIRVIHISTDAVFQGNKETPYYEDHPCDGTGDYATSKILGEIYAPNVFSIRCSIMGHERNRCSNLLNWFLSRADGESIQGYTNHIWNGVTTLQLCGFIHKIITENSFDEMLKKTNVIHFSPNLPLTKFELLVFLNEIYQKNVNIIPSKAGENIVRILNSRFEHFYLNSGEGKKSIREEIVKMKDFESFEHGNGDRR